MRAGVPMLIMPFSHDQPDQARRMQRLGIGRTLPRRRYNADRAALELRILLDDRSYRERAKSIGERVSQEDGAKAACDAILTRCLL
jgi:UDP:flavonoid glycosyltransferase YjiC (YdhE family)